MTQGTHIIPKAFEELAKEEDFPRLYRVWRDANNWKWPHGLEGEPENFAKLPKNNQKGDHQARLTKQKVLGWIIDFVEEKAGFDYLERMHKQAKGMKS